MKSPMTISGVFHLKHARDGLLIRQYEIRNAVCDAAKTDLLSRFFKRTAGYSSWYIGLIDNVNFVDTNLSDTMASHPNWQEFTDYSYDDSNLRYYLQRPLWAPGTATNPQLATSNGIQMAFQADATIQGLFICSSQMKKSTSGMLWSVARFATPPSLKGGDSLIATYTLSL